MERKSGSLQLAGGPSVIEPEELLHHNQLAINALQSGSSSSHLLQQQVIDLTSHIRELRDRHRLELAEAQGNLEQKGLPTALLDQPIPVRPIRRKVTFDLSDPNLETDIQDLELTNMDLQAQVQQLSGEIAQGRIRERQLHQQVQSLDKRPAQLSLDSPPINLSPCFATDGTAYGPLFNEPTQLEYLRNILFQYMMGKQTKTLARVIGTIVKFSDDQTKNVISREDSKASGWLTPTH